MKQPLKIAFIVGTFPVISQTFIINQINALIDEGLDVKLFAFKKGDVKRIHKSVVKHDLLNNITYIHKKDKSIVLRYLKFVAWTIKHVFRIKWKPYFQALNVFKYGKKALSLGVFYNSAWRLIEADFNIVHVHFAQNAIPIAEMKSFGLFPENTKLVTTFHGYDIQPKKHDFYHKVYTNVIQYTDLFTVNTPYLKQQLQTFAPHLNNIDVLPVGLDTEFFKREQPHKENTYFDVVFCGRLISLKGPQLALKIIEELHNKGHRNVRLHIIGNGPLKTELKKQIKEKSLQKSVLMVNAIDQGGLKTYLETAHVLIMPGIPDAVTGQEESQGLVIQEAQAMELPVVVSDVGGMKYGLMPNESGFVVEANNIHGFASAIETLILDEALRLKMGKTGSAFVRKNYDSKILIAQLINQYNKLLNI